MRLIDHVFPLFALALVAGGAPTAKAETPAQPQAQAQAPAQAEGRQNCDSSTRAEPATPEKADNGDGTAPSNSGSTGWSGGTGGAYIGTNPSGSISNSGTEQPQTGRGLDLNTVPTGSC